MLVAGGVLALQHSDIVADGDFAVDEIALMRSTHFAQLVGNYSRFGWSHLGPAWFYALDFVYAPLGQSSRAFFVAALALHGLAACLIVIVAWRIGGPVLAAVASLLLLWFVFTLGLPIFRSAWPPYETILPIVLFLLLAAYGASGSTLAVIGALLVGSYEAQLHVGTVPTIAIALGAMVMIRVVGLRWPARRALLADVTGRPLAVGLVALGLVTLIAMWAPVAVDEVTRHPGNLTKLANFFFFLHLPHHHLHEGVAALARHLAVFPFGHLPPGAESNYSALTLKRLLIVSGFLAMSGGLAAVGTVVRDRFAQSLGVILFVVTIGLVWSISRAIGELSSYFLVWTTTLPVVLILGWLALLINAARSRWQPTWLSWRARALAVGIVGMLLLFASIQTVGFIQLPTSALEADPGTRAMVTLVEGSLAGQPRDPVLVTIVGLDAWPAAAGVTLQLVKQGRPVSVRPEYQFMFGDQMRVTGRERLELVFVPESGLAQFDQHAAGLTFLGAGPTCGSGCMIYVFTRTPAVLP